MSTATTTKPEKTARLNSPNPETAEDPQTTIAATIHTMGHLADFTKARWLVEG